MAGSCKYSCETATQTLEWIHAIVDFIRPYAFLINAHVVNFLQDRLWEALDKEWIDCLRKESVENLLLIPYGVVQDYWPASLKEFIVTLRSLVLPREQADLQMVYPRLHMTSLNSVVTLGMNPKKKHEVENLSAVVSSIANSLGANTIVDVGSGQGYLAQVLSFEYHHSVVAIDACSHHGSVTNARAERIKKYYAAKLRKSDSGIKSLKVPKTITCRVMSIDMLKSLTDKSANDGDVQQLKSIAQDNERLDSRKPQSFSLEDEDSIVLAGLHACGDLSVTMLKTFSECKNVRAVVSIGCCYNLLSEQDSESDNSQCGFPLSCGVKSAGVLLGRNSRDLACQSAERWKSLGKDAGLHNFELHAFRAAFQTVLCKYYPEVVVTSPSIGRQGKTMRRQQQRRILESSLHPEENTILTLSQNRSIKRGSCPTIRHEERKTDDTTSRMLEKDDLLHDISSNGTTESEGTKFIDKFSHFKKFCQSGLCRLSLEPLQDVDLLGMWKKAEPFIDLVGPYWSLRAAFGPLLETFLLLDRLLFLQEQDTSFEVAMLPIFDPALSPRNVAIIAKRKNVETYSVL